MPNTETRAERQLIAAEPYMERMPRLQYGLGEAAIALDLPQSTLEAEVRAGRGPLFFKVGRRLYTTRELITAWQREKIEQARELAAAG
jgi:hypothetical protein